MRLLFILTCVLLSGISFGQSGKKKKTTASEKETTSQPTSLNPETQQRPEEKKSKKSSSGETTYNSEKEYYDRMSALEKTRRKNERMLDNPQYSDPAYFGHKRPPKRRPPNKMKFCKVCGIRH